MRTIFTFRCFTEGILYCFVIFREIPGKFGKCKDSFAYVRTIKFLKIVIFQQDLIVIHCKLFHVIQRRLRLAFNFQLILSIFSFQILIFPSLHFASLTRLYFLLRFIQEVSNSTWIHSFYLIRLKCHWSKALISLPGCFHISNHWWLWLLVPFKLWHTSTLFKFPFPFVF
jgi:hypothetical protein